MKKTISLILAVIFIVSIVTVVSADESSWYCETCSTERTTEYCPTCGNKKPAAQLSSWTCPNCGQEYPTEYLYCPNDGGAQVVSSGSWPYRDCSGTVVSFRDFNNDEYRHQSYYGPGKQYAQAGAYKPYKVKTASVLFQEGDYVLVDFDYKTAGKHCVYFKASNLVPKPLLENVNLTGYPAVTTTMLIPMCGPGTDYEYVTQKVQSKYAPYDPNSLSIMFGDTWICIYRPIIEATKTDKHCVYLEQGTAVSVFFEYNGWVFAEFQCEAGLVRAWLPTSSVTAQ